MWPVHAAAAQLRGLCSEDVLGAGAQHQGMLNSDNQMLLLEAEQLESQTAVQAHPAASRAGDSTGVSAAYRKR